MNKLCIFAAVTALVIFTAPGAMASRRIVSESESNITESRIPHDLEDMKELVITIRDGVICALDGQGNICFKTDIPADSLTASDRLILSRGVKVEDYLALIAMLENYNS